MAEKEWDRMEQSEGKRAYDRAADRRRRARERARLDTPTLFEGPPRCAYNRHDWEPDGYCFKCGYPRHGRMARTPLHCRVHGFERLRRTPGRYGGVWCLKKHLLKNGTYGAKWIDRWGEFDFRPPRP